MIKGFSVLRPKVNSKGVCSVMNPERLFLLSFRKSMQRNKQMTIGRKKFNMDPKKVRKRLFLMDRDWKIKRELVL